MSQCVSAHVYACAHAHNVVFDSKEQALKNSLVIYINNSDLALLFYLFFSFFASKNHHHHHLVYLIFYPSFMFRSKGELSA